MADQSPPDISDDMMPGEMLTVIQTEMDSIREDQQALKDEIEKIKSEFYNLINSCAFDDSNFDLTASLDVPETPCSPPRLRVRSATPGKDMSPKPAPAKGGCSYGDKLIQMMLEMPSSYLDDSESLGSPSGPIEAKGEQKSPKGPEIPGSEPKPIGAPERLVFENPVDSTRDCTQNCTGNENHIDTKSNLSYYPDRENKPFLDSVRFNPDSVLNSTSICESSVYKFALNCTAADGYTSVNCRESLMLNCTPADSHYMVNGHQIYVNPASVLNCTPAGVNPLFVSNTSAMVNTASIIVNPASVLDCSPAQVTESDCHQGEGAYVNSNGAQLDENPSSSFNSTSAQRHPSSGFREVLGEANPSSSSCPSSTSSDYPSSRCRDVLGEAQPSAQPCRQCHLADGNPSTNCKSKSLEHNSLSFKKCDHSKAQPSSLESYRSSMGNPSSHSSSGSELAQPLAISTSASGVSVPTWHGATSAQNQRNLFVTMNTTPAINSSSYNHLALHSTPAVNTGRQSHLMPANLNPTCSAIVNYSISSSESEHSDASSRCGPKSSNGDVSDFQPCPDRQQEMMSRMKYYSDFTIDRQRKINKMRSKHDTTKRQDNGSSSQDDVPNDTLCRFVEGAEERSHQVCLIGPPYSSRSGSIGSSSSGGSSTLQKTAVSQSHYSNSPSPKQSHPVGQVLKSSENTHAFHSGPGSEKRRSKASSTASDNSTSPPSSAYTWSVRSSSHNNNNNTDSSSHRHHRSRHHGERKRGDKRPRSSRKRSSHQDIPDEGKHIHCRDHAIHTMLGQPCNQVVKYLPIQQFYPKDLILSNDSLYDDGYKSQTLPRSSTKKSLNPCSSNSSLEAKRNSVPDIRALKSPPNSALFSSGSDSISSKYPPGRLGCIGMSTTSGSQDSQGTDSSVPRSKGRASSSVETNENTGLTDSILTDSPKSVSSSGIFAPCNSPDATVGSRISCSTIADSQHIDLRGISVIHPNATALSGISAIQSASDISEFKVPKAPPPKKSSRRKGNRCSTPDVRTSTPKPKSYPNSVQSEQISRRKLFSSSSSTQSQSSYGSSSRLLDKKSVIKKFRRFSENFYKTKSGKVQIETLANL